MKNDWYFVDALQARDSGGDIDASANRDSVTFPFMDLVLGLFKCDNVAAASRTAANGSDSSMTLDKLPDLEGVGIVFEILDVGLRSNEVGSLLRESKVGERC